MVEQENFRIRAIIKGRVQGVGFRQFIYEQARRLGLKGFVRNDRYDRQQVEVVAEGAREKLQKLESCLHSGPPGAKVTAAQIGWEQATENFERFEITY